MKRLYNKLTKLKTKLAYALSKKNQLKVGISSSLLDLEQDKNKLKEILLKNIIPFWYPQIIDLENGGYQLNHNCEGKFKGKTNKYLVTQARTLWFFSRLVNSRYVTNEYLKAAQHGYKFLSEQMWDQEYGGFYWEVYPSGKTVNIPDKDMYGQAFGLYALSEYAIASGDQSAITLANKLFQLWEEYAYDSEYGGYREIFQQDWSSVSSAEKIKMKGLPRLAPTNKLMNTHLHLMEALTLYCKVTNNSIAKQRLLELIIIQSNTVLRKTIGACTDQYQPNWTYLSGINFDYISYGHDLENIWLLMDAGKIAGLSVNLFLDLYKTLFNYALKYGYDLQKGGFYDSGFYHRFAHKRAKTWWVQAESLVAALRMYKITKDKIYYNCFAETLDWIYTYQVDWQQGEWHFKILPNGKKIGDKAGAWKSPYHNARSMLECLDTLHLLR
ncbi:MAG: AGE family epimerase/isomerase [Cyanobacteria bacterium P01_H01_bin.35]